MQGLRKLALETVVYRLILYLLSFLQDNFGRKVIWFGGKQSCLQRETLVDHDTSEDNRASTVMVFLYLKMVNGIQSEFCLFNLYC